jgi:hypothetical protein
MITITTIFETDEISFYIFLNFEEFEIKEKMRLLL